MFRVLPPKCWVGGGCWAGHLGHTDRALYAVWWGSPLLKVMGTPWRTVGGTVMALGRSLWELWGEEAAEGDVVGRAICERSTPESWLGQQGWEERRGNQEVFRRWHIGQMINWV